MLMYFWHYFTVNRSVAGPDFGRLINPAFYYYYHSLFTKVFSTYDGFISFVKYTHVNSAFATTIYLPSLSKLTLYIASWLQVMKVMKVRTSDHNFRFDVHWMGYIACNIEIPILVKRIWRHTHHNDYHRSMLTEIVIHIRRKSTKSCYKKKNEMEIFSDVITDQWRTPTSSTYPGVYPGVKYEYHEMREAGSKIRIYLINHPLY